MKGGRTVVAGRMEEGRVSGSVSGSGGIRGSGCSGHKTLWRGAGARLLRLLEAARSLEGRGGACGALVGGAPVRGHGDARVISPAASDAPPPGKPPRRPASRPAARHASPPPGMPPLGSAAASRGVCAGLFIFLTAGLVSSSSFFYPSIAAATRWSQPAWQPRWLPDRCTTSSTRRCARWSGGTAAPIGGGASMSTLWPERSPSSC